MPKPATAPRSALDCDTPRAARPAGRLPRLPGSPAPAAPSETPAAGNGGIGLPPPARRLAVQRGSTSLRSVVFPLPLVLPSLPPVRIKPFAQPLGAETFSSVNRHIARRHSRQKFLRPGVADRKSTRLNSSHQIISYAVFCLKKKHNLLHVS